MSNGWAIIKMMMMILNYLKKYYDVLFTQGSLISTNIVLPEGPVIIWLPWL